MRVDTQTPGPGPARQDGTVPSAVVRGRGGVWGAR